MICATVNLFLELYMYYWIRCLGTPTPYKISVVSWMQQNLYFWFRLLAQKNIITSRWLNGTRCTTTSSSNYPPSKAIHTFNTYWKRYPSPYLDEQSKAFRTTNLVVKSHTLTAQWQTTPHFSASIDCPSSFLKSGAP